jgi:hypothetical protein
MWSYPAVLVAEDRVLIQYNHFPRDIAGQQARGHRLKVLPLSWFYGGQDPTTENPTLAQLERHVRGDL